MPTNINLNDKMIFKLTDEGRKILREHYTAIFSSYPPLIEESMENAERGMQIWDFMNVFGKYFYMGNPKLPIENMNVQIEKQ